ncbi:MAG: hypothetical protein HYW49_08770 [Deltaproteobacteria bacterium]|nr:hypothetical protein [Deltaproteobacteria bacterium]
MTEEKSRKKDLTSILDLAADHDAGESAGDAGDASREHALPVPAVEQLTEKDFGILEELPPQDETPPESVTSTIPLELTVTTAQENPALPAPDLFSQAEVAPAEPVAPEPGPAIPIGPRDLTAVREFGQRVAIGSPQVEASPPYSLLARGTFDENARKQIASVILGEESLGIRPDELAIQLEAGKVLVPRVSEFAAIAIAAKIRDVVDDLRIGPAAEIYRAESAGEEEPAYIQRDRYQPNQPLIKK